MKQQLASCIMAIDSDQRPESPEFSPLAIDADLTPLPEYKKAGTTTLDFDGLLSAPLRLREDLSSGCGGQLWPAGMVLATHMLRYHQDKLGDARILELGAGGGLVSLAVARGCQDIKHRILVTDQEEMFSLMEHNVRLNGVEDRAKAMVLNWGDELPQEVVESRPNVILAADCVYFEPAFPLLQKTMADLLALCPEDATIYFCFKKRRRADMQFLKKAQKLFSVVEVADQARPVFSREGLFLYAISSKQRQQ
ncbi:hypothetical protein MAPG_07467 [Magnaporthiopsis poae ATCC 64411]|uniref:Protein-lysine N-methyltransferase EFM6 n=1 Tax=Magnaporthiopsis poae (strain ATCC 64411 / 73-15) TaxID=644358 RepID=A0A0C4E4R7_MAGP6|nr:hypothetical protein MAPG_07467 [Magnaporthiopsis poae ATCC 64411]